MLTYYRIIKNTITSRALNQKCNLTYCEFDSTIAEVELTCGVRRAWEGMLSPASSANPQTRCDLRNGPNK